MLRLLLSLSCLAILGYAAYRWLPAWPAAASASTAAHTQLPAEPAASAPDSSAKAQEISATKLAPTKTVHHSPEQPVGRPIVNTLELQMALARPGFSPGSIDGSIGTQTRQALSAYQLAHQLHPSGEFDHATQATLKITEPIYARVTLTASDFAAIDPPPVSWRERGNRTRMAYHSILEMLAETCMSDPDLIQQLNPELDFNSLQPGQVVVVPHMPPVRLHHPVSHLQISLSARTLQAISPHGRIVFHCPVSIARRVDKRPSGALRVEVRVENPNYTFNPAILSSAAAREGISQKFVIQPGPNNPVGSIWIGLNLPSYGIHGTPEPEKVGRTESSGCFRLANWNAQTLIGLVEVGTTVHVDP
ncbi:L,D-transpeptidase [Coraliomargarita algicola]|uniref:L,D-transpeptidase n=1 Tax=Coraliomargarita algicola TaxID=3092156 RepID=A0ABZ0RN41_9BACT|nr:L,D-transpeptidase [Coraliomargarita sp. J2-16]WPJ96185.1 L,D-transpeptidase [Coraliomargarita sp. J2-16]